MVAGSARIKQAEGTEVSPWRHLCYEGRLRLSAAGRPVQRGQLAPQPQPIGSRVLGDDERQPPPVADHAAGHPQHPARAAGADSSRATCACRPSRRSRCSISSTIGCGCWSTSSTLPRSWWPRLARARGCGGSTTIRRPLPARAGLPRGVRGPQRPTAASIRHPQPDRAATRGGAPAG